MIQTLQSGIVGVVFWSQDPTPEDCEIAFEHAKTMALKLGRPAPLLSILLPGTKMPGQTTLLRMKALWPELLDRSSTLQFVNLARGFTGSRIILGVIVPVFQLGARGKVGVHQEVNPALADLIAIEPSIRTDELVRAINAVRIRAESAGI